MFSLLMLVSSGFSHNPETYRTGELETVVRVNMNVCDGLTICPGGLLSMTQERLQPHDPT